MDAERPSEQLIGGDKDSHDCLIAADYSWCEVKQKCLRTWEEKCEVATTTDQTASWKTYRNDKYGYEIKYPEDFFWMYSNPNTPDPARMNFVEIVNFSDKTKSLTIDTLYPDEELKNRTLSSHTNPDELDIIKYAAQKYNQNKYQIIYLNPNLPALKWDNLMNEDIDFPSLIHPDLPSGENIRLLIRKHLTKFSLLFASRNNCLRPTHLAG